MFISKKPVLESLHLPFQRELSLKPSRRNPSENFTWRPLVSQAGSTNVVQVRATDDGSPALSPTNSFNAVVNPLSAPTISSISASTGQVALTIKGAAGPDYTVLTSTNLVNWDFLMTTNPPGLPFTLNFTTATETKQFYRIQLGP